MQALNECISFPDIADTKSYRSTISSFAMRTFRTSDLPKGIKYIRKMQADLKYN